MIVIITIYQVYIYFIFIIVPNCNNYFKNVKQIFHSLMRWSLGTYFKKLNISK